MDTETKEWKPRLTVEITPEQYYALRKHISYGLQRKVFSAIVDDIVENLDKYGEIFVLAILNRRISYRKEVELFVERNSEHGNTLRLESA